MVVSRSPVHAASRYPATGPETAPQGAGAAWSAAGATPRRSGRSRASRTERQRARKGATGAPSAATPSRPHRPDCGPGSSGTEQRRSELGGSRLCRRRLEDPGLTAARSLSGRWPATQRPPSPDASPPWRSPHVDAGVRRWYHYDMQALHIRAVPDHVVAALKRRARANHRSLQGEVLAALEEAALRAPPPERPDPLDLALSDAPGVGTWSREETYDDDAR